MLQKLPLSVPEKQMNIEKELLSITPAKGWNDLDESVRILENFKDFKNDICICMYC